MLHRAQFFEWEIEYDKEVTPQAYSILSVSCTCAYCQNFLSVCRNLPVEYIHLLEQLGIDPLKPVEIVEYTENPDGTHFYGWWYHLVGQITKDSTAISVLLTPGIEMIIRNKADLADMEFPRPVIQIEFFSNLPWALAEKPNY